VSRRDGGEAEYILPLGRRSGSEGDAFSGLQILEDAVIY
jgi:hypothetical protein